MSDIGVKEIMLILGGISASFKWVYEYAKKNKWEKNKFLLSELEKFESYESTQAVHKMLDWNSITVKIDGESIKVNDQILFDALQTHDVKNIFTLEEVEIRKTFDQYFDNLTKLVLMAESNIISRKNFSMFMRYWLDILNGTTQDKPDHVLNQLRAYMEFYGYDVLIDFLETEMITR